MIKIHLGLNLPITGEPEQIITDDAVVKSVAVVAPDFHGMKPSMSVKVGDSVRLGSLLFTDKRTAGVKYTSPAGGIVQAINRGDKRILQSVVIDIDNEHEQYESFKKYTVEEIMAIGREDLVSQLNNSGLWIAFRTRPYSKAPELDATPHSIFVNMMDTNPLSLDPQVVLKEFSADFSLGITILKKLTSGKVFLCKVGTAKVDVKTDEQVTLASFSGVHPAGNTGTHIHFLDPVSADKTVWSIGYQDVIAFGQLFATGLLNVNRVISLAGPQVVKPRLLKTRLGANVNELTQGQLKSGENRIISGSVFGGRIAERSFSFLGRYHQQISVLSEDSGRPFLHYLRAGFNRFSVLPIFISKLFSRRKFDFTTTTGGSERAMVPLGSYEKVMPLDILATQLLRALIVGDTEMAQKLGCLELDEEDLALCTFVCPGKYEYGPILRKNLTRIEKEG